MIDIDKFRKQLMISAIGAVEIKAVYKPETSEPAANFVCVACAEPLAWTGRHNEYQCTGCEYDLTAKEAIDLCDKYIKLITELSGQAARKRSFWRRLLGRS